jgi:arylsulfatase
VLLDDVGFGQLGAFGGPYHTPTIDALAENGLRYTSFHTTGLSAPTRAALMTGRNHHSVNMGTTTNATLTPGYTGILPKTAGTIAQTLKPHGYATAIFGKWHLTPTNEMTTKGPFDRWPTHLGFDEFYGFQGAETSQWHPALWHNTLPVDPPKTPGYHLSPDLADHAIAWLADRKTKGEPFFLYFAPAAGHAPHHVPAEYIAHYKGAFDLGWDKQRAVTFARQKEIGVVARDATLPQRPNTIRSWDSLSPDEKRLYARMQEVHAGFVEQADHELGRVIDALRASGELDDTLVIVTSDNGASGEGGPFGSLNEMRVVNGVNESLSDNLDHINDLGGRKSYNHYPAGWALAGNTPFRYWKQLTHEGGIRDPFIVSWLSEIPVSERGGIRTQFHHVVDVAPTILEATGAEMLDAIDGIPQTPLEGRSMEYSFHDPDAPTPRLTQYFEMLGNRAIWANGWKAVAWHGRLAWEAGQAQLASFAMDHWELYDLAHDPTETTDLAAQNPEKLVELRAIFERDARERNVYPLDASGLFTRDKALQLKLSGGRGEVEYEGAQTRIPESATLPIAGASHSIEAEIDVPESGADGVIVTQGGRFGGYALIIKNGRLKYEHNFVGDKVFTLESSVPVPAGKVTVRFEFIKTGMVDHVIPYGGARLFINGMKVAEGPLARTTPQVFSRAETLDIGSDTITPVSDDYDTPFAFTGRIHRVTIKLTGTP